MRPGTIRRALVSVVAVVLCALGALVGFAVWVVGLGRGLQDFCVTSPAVDLHEGQSVTGPAIEWPNHLRCSFDLSDRPDVVATSWAPLLWTGFCAIVVLAGVAVVALAARRLARPG